MCLVYVDVSNLAALLLELKLYFWLGTVGDRPRARALHTYLLVVQKARAIYYSRNNNMDVFQEETSIGEDGVCTCDAGLLAHGRLVGWAVSPLDASSMHV